MIIPSFKAGILTFIRKIVAAVPPTPKKILTSGNNFQGRLGLGNTTNQSSPVQVGTGTDWSTAVGGGAHVIAIKNTGTMWAWGAGSNYRLGLGDTLNRSSPVQIGTGTDWSTVSAGNYHGIAIKTNGTLWGWGLNNNGQLGLNYFKTFVYSPIQIGTDTNWSKITCGFGGSSFAIKTNGTLWAWGANSNGALGLGNTTVRSSPVQVGTDTNWSKVVSGGSAASIHTLALKTNGTLWAWGVNSSGRLGLNNTTYRSSPVQVGTSTDWKDVATGRNFTVATKTTGTLWSWGSNGSGQLAASALVQRSSPVQVGSLTDWSNVWTGQYHVIAKKTDATLWAWGYNNIGQLGLNTIDNTRISSPLQVGTDTDWSGNAENLGIAFSLFTKTTGTLWARGLNSYGRLGLGDTVNRTSSPIQVGTDTNWSKVSCGYNFTSAIKTTGTLWSWGRNSYGQLGSGNLTSRSSPVQVGTGTDWSMVSSGSYNVMAIKTTGTLWGWGRNQYGQLGLGNTINRSSPVQVGTGTDWSKVSCQERRSAALKTDGTIWTWGRNNLGQLGLGNVTDRSSPVQVGTDINWSDISSGESHTIAVKTTGTLWAWGSGSDGRLGLGNTTNRSSPVQVGSLTDWSKVYTGSNFCIAKKTDNTIWSWGSNNYGQLGLGISTAFSTARSSPVQIGTDSNWSKINVGSGSVIAVKTNGTMWAWGRNSNSQLVRHTPNYSSPVQIGTGVTWDSAPINNSVGFSVFLENTS
jgi:alpha-tubulin suppressor-like RCC1 family protein